MRYSVTQIATFQKAMVLVLEDKQLGESATGKYIVVADRNGNGVFDGGDSIITSIGQGTSCSLPLTQEFGWCHANVTQFKIQKYKTLINRWFKKAQQQRQSLKRTVKGQKRGSCSIDLGSFQYKTFLNIPFQSSLSLRTTRSQRRYGRSDVSSIESRRVVDPRRCRVASTTSNVRIDGRTVKASIEMDSFAFCRYSNLLTSFGLKNSPRYVDVSLQLGGIEFFHVDMNK